MTVTSGFFNSRGGDRLYNAAQMSNYYRGIISDGVVANYGDSLQVAAGSGMQVQVKKGRAYIDSRWMENDAPVDVSINAAHVTLNRYTAIVVQLDYTNRIMSIVAVDGTNAANPTKPAMIDTASIKQICLAYVYVAAGATSITGSNIEDTRSDSSVCGWVTGLIEQVDTSTLFAQWQAAYNENLAEMEDWEIGQKQVFETWLSTLTEQLTVGAYINEFEKSVTDTNVIALDMTGYTYEASDIITVYLNGLKLISGTDYSISTNAGTRTITADFTPVAGNGDVLDVEIYKSVLGTVIL